MGEEEECEEDDDDDYDYIEDKILNQNNPNTTTSGMDQRNVLQNLINGDSQDKSMRK